MSKSGMQVDISQIDSLIKDLSGEDLRKAALSGMRRGAVILQKKTEDNVKAKISIGSHKEQVTRSSGKKVSKIRRIAAIRVSKKEMSVKVHIMSDFRIKFFEMGTMYRKTKGHKNTGYYQRKQGGRKYVKRSGRGGGRGTIRPGWFFRSAQSQTKDQVFSNIETYITKAMIKINNKKR